MIHICILFFAGAQRISFCSQVIGRNLNKTSRGNKMDDDDNIHIQILKTSFYVTVRFIHCFNYSFEFIETLCSI